uniref:hypoxia-inducible factor-proline dioxygenase n=1 Tax=Strigamia maritima TaxID=126957 RepID=T1IPS4_STRMM
MAATQFIEKPSCQYCGRDDSLQECSRCQSAFYCSTDHKKKHWKVHRKTCGNKTAAINNTDAIITLENDLAGLLYKTVVASQAKSNQSLKRTKDGDICEIKPFINNVMTSEANLSHHNSKQHMAVSFQQPKKVKYHSLYAEKFIKNSSRCRVMSEDIINNLNKSGISVTDNFLGEKFGTAILDEVLSMYSSGVFTDGRLVCDKVKRDSSTVIRGDKIAWVNGSTTGCPHIYDFIEIVDLIIRQCKCNANNGEFGKRNIGGRTQAMVACYPGGGAQYVQHVDNPNKDGRCITSIYYLNKGWSEEQGGILRIFPTDNEEKVANIIPIFDRLIFFWSDRRNPHSVDPSYKTRYAITLWYFDQDEQERHRAKLGKVTIVQ